MSHINCFNTISLSQPARAVWIEINMSSESGNYYPSQPARAVWIEIMKSLTCLGKTISSQPARAVWIEI